MPRYLARAKVNLRLTVLAREDTGFHQIETLFCALELADELEIERVGAGIALEVEGADVGPVEHNLVYRAARAFCDAAAVSPVLRIVLHKHIPAGAGLGGGSSDAATTLRALNELHGGPLDNSQLLKLGAALGSDIGFFLADAPLALAWGRGDRLLPLPAPSRRSLLIVAPPEQIATADAYAALARVATDGRKRFTAAVHDLFSLVRWEGIAAAAANDFEEVAFQQIPDLERIRDLLRAAGASPALLSGSGSALFGVFESEEACAAARIAIADAVPDARLIHTHTAVARSWSHR